MEKQLRQVIQEITKKHLKKYKSQVFGQNLTGVGWVDNTLPKLYEKDGVIELPMADVAGGGIVTGSGLMGRRPIYIIRYQGYNWFNCIFIVNYACKAYEIWKRPCPIFIRGIALEGSIGPVAGSSHISIFYKMPGIKIFSPMTAKEYKLVYKNFIKNKDVYYISEHRKSYNFVGTLKNFLPKKPDIVIISISVTRFEAEKVKNYFKNTNIKVGLVHIYKIKPFNLSNKIYKYLQSSKHGIILTDNDYEDGLLRIISSKIKDNINCKIKLLGLKNKSAGHHKNVDNLPPDFYKMKKKIYKIIK